MSWGHAFVVFVAALAADITWAFWALSTASHKPLRAALWAVAIILLGWVNVDAYISSAWYVVPSMAGAFVGTFVAVWHSKNRNVRNVR